MTDHPPPAAGFVLTLACADRPGIVAGVSRALAEAGGDIRGAQQFGDEDTGRFFMRVVATLPPDGEAAVRAALGTLGAEFGMRWRLSARGTPRRVLLLASRFDHCLADLLYRWRTGELRIEPVGVVSNHPRGSYPALDFGSVPFHHLPVGADNRAEQEAAVWRLFQDSGAEFAVLARYMQVLSDDLSAKLAGRCINIHHSFLPGFKGARPYHQAHARGVKLIGATAHFVTADLDEGPIIEQDVERISHADSPADLIRKGRDIERRVLAQAVRMFCEDRILLDGVRTVVFGD
ncbi:formyltetrahydrofolate deformylase [Rhizosaccharibacter radicis]|uniref:Formyltetrahydrofolate deformylase n=1 Tax=Rhizosaccharibacter radicis TaxID=2782605 RepID=A0ABT1W0C6_9PROT|nr:formyltetrahydrofolate deformylase [Acetobacteraceae bacterium KSS12]